MSEIERKAELLAALARLPSDSRALATEGLILLADVCLAMGADRAQHVSQQQMEELLRLALMGELDQARALADDLIARGLLAQALPDWEWGDNGDRL